MWENHTCGLEGGTPGLTGCPYPIQLLLPPFAFGDNVLPRTGSHHKTVTPTFHPPFTSETTKYGSIRIQMPAAPSATPKNIPLSPPSPSLLLLILLTYTTRIARMA
jgi:hypothetical protein